MKLAAFVAVGVFVMLWTSSCSQRSAQPNFVYILADDLGYGDLGSYGQTKIRTPSLDRMAAGGLRFTQHYSGASACAPSRFTLMTGKHIGRSDTYGNVQKLKHEEETIAEVLKRAGYTTGAVGKWALGTLPTQHGFDEWYGFMSQNYAHFHYPEFIWDGEERVEIAENRNLRVNGRYPPGKGVYIQDRFTEKALSFITRHRNEPFFLYLAYTIPHLELAVPDDSLVVYKGTFEEISFDTTATSEVAGRLAFYDGHGYCSSDNPRATYASMISRMDRDIGRILALLEELGLDNDTLVVFSSDNGPTGIEAGDATKFFKSAGGLRGGKGLPYEGGIRVPMIAWWPGRIQAGGISDHVSYFPDILPTFADLAGFDVVEPVDGISMTPTLLGQSGQKNGFQFWAKAIRKGKWKYVEGRLYNLDDDPGETTDLAVEHPDIVHELNALWHENAIPDDSL